MLFFAQSEGKNHQIEVQESALKWQVRIRDLQTQHEDVHTVDKKDFRQFGELISFLFRHSSYLVDIVTEGDSYTVFTRGSLKTIRILTEEKLLHSELTYGKSRDQENHIKSKMPGKIIDLAVQAGDKVEEGDLIVVMEAMKMENEMRAAFKGVVQKIYVQKNQSVETGALLVSIKPQKT